MSVEMGRPDDDREVRVGDIRAELISEIAICLHHRMEHLDPTGEYDWESSKEANWLSLDPRTKNFYEECVLEIMSCLDRHRQ